MDPDRSVDPVTLSAGDTELTVLVDLGMVASSLRHGGEEFVSFHGGVAAVRGGHTTGVPLLAPWANRLRGPDYRAGDRSVAVVGTPGVHLDANGLPIHGTMVGRAGWVADPVRSTGSGRSGATATLSASFDASADLDVMTSFPFAHRLTVEYRLEPARLTVSTTLEATGAVAVPVCFGWHPYFRLPGGDRDRWTLELPTRRHLALDELQLPTGVSEDEPAELVLLAGRSFDDGYALGEDRRFALSGSGRRIEITFGGAYPFAQLYAPVGSPFVAVEPMTASTDALTRAATACVAPGQHLTATFAVELS